MGKNCRREGRIQSLDVALVPDVYRLSKKWRHNIGITFETVKIEFEEFCAAFVGNAYSFPVIQLCFEIAACRKLPERPNQD